MYVLLKLLRYLIGEVQDDPTAYTLLARLKTLETTLTTLDENTDGLEGLLANNATTTLQTSILTQLVAIAGHVNQHKQYTAITMTYLDGIEGLLSGGLPSILDADKLKVRATEIETWLSALYGKLNQQAQIISLMYTLLGTGIGVTESSPTAHLATTSNTYNETMTLADTQYSQALPAGTKKFIVKTRDGTAFRIAFVTGKVAAPTEPYTTIDANVAWNEDGLNLTGITMYFACGSAGKIVELQCWS